MGSMACPKVMGSTKRGDGRCAIGAAFLAIGRGEEEDYSRIGEAWPMAYGDVVNPITGESHVLFGVIRELNDNHEWTRERIADWVETIEAQAEAPQPAVVETVTA